MSSTERKNAYQVVARRFRPRTFAEVVGQDEVLHSLRHTIVSGRIPHAFLFAGSRGVGKTTLARILARCLNCAQGPTPDPCGECEPCRSILEERNADFVEIDAASHNGVDDIRELRERVGFASMGSRYKVYLLDEAHMLSKPAWNAFLKTLEEPPPNVVFIMATTELAKVPDTIRSRCRLETFRQVSEADIAARLQRICQSEGVTVDVEVLADLARKSRGGLRDAETALERVLASAQASGGTMTFAEYQARFHRVGFEQARDVVAALVAGEAGPALRFAAQIEATGADEREALGDLLDVLRVLLLLLVDGKDTPLVAYDGDRAGLLALAERAGVERIDAMIQAGLAGRERLRQLEDRRLVLEVTLLRMARVGALPLLADLARAVASGEGGDAGPASAPAARRPAAAGAAVPAPAAAAPVAASGDPAARLRAWAEKHRPSFLSTIEACSITMEGDVVTLTLASERKLHRDRLASPGVKQEVAQVLSESYGRPIVVQVRDAGAVNSAGPTPSAAGASAPAARRTVEPGEAVQRVAKRFDGRIIRSEDRAPE
ncbi:MAG TPA: DNA polymerase III subunit gamma/tau [Planctomycetota bacterium]|nr:DNA polymerase III subunit gamma/tau [Planctomycetota bacterium]